MGERKRAVLMEEICGVVGREEKRKEKVLWLLNIVTPSRAEEGAESDGCG